MIIDKTSEPSIQQLEEIVDVYFGVQLEENDPRIQELNLHEGHKENAFTVWVTYKYTKPSEPEIDFADGGLSERHFTFSDDEKKEILSYVEESGAKQRVDWNYSEKNKAIHK